ncbi:MAG: thioredoxin-related protein [Bacteroidia bacterium]|jgi:thioredoxin-related protein
MMSTRLLIGLIIISFVGCADVQTGRYVTANQNVVSLENRNVALMWLAPDCPLCQTYSSDFIMLSQTFSSQVSFYGVLPSNQYTNAEIQHFVDSFGFDIPIILDETYELTKRFNATVTPEFILIDSSFTVQYQGKFDDWATDLGQKKLKPTAFYFKDALQSFTAGQPVLNRYVEPIGCVIELD